MEPLRIAPGLTLPPTVVSETMAVVGMRGSGKTYLAGKLVELMLDGGSQVVVIDPVGVWGRGLRLAADGKGAGIAIPVFGGWSGDVPLEPTGGELVAQLIVEKRLSAVLDVSEMTLGGQHRFVTAFATTLYNLKKRQRSPIHVVFEEAHEFLPQIVSGGEAEMVGAVKRLWKVGRNFGIGATIVTQRPAEVNKGALNLTDRMFCGRLRGAHDRKAVEGWALDQGADRRVLDDLHKMAPGDLCHWTDAGPVAIHCYPKRTFDASRTPDADAGAGVVQLLPGIDVSAVREAMAATIAEAAANDPRALRARIAELEKAGGAPNREAAAQIADLVAKLRALEGVTPAEVRRLRDLEHYFTVVIGAVDAYRKPGGRAVVDYSGFVPKAPPAGEDRLPGQVGTLHRPGLPDAVLVADELPRARIVAPVQTLRAGKVVEGSAMPYEARQILTVLAQFPGRVTRRKITAMTGYPVGGASMKKGFASLRANGWMGDFPDGDVEISELGVGAIGRVEPPPTGPSLREWWRQQLPHEALKCFDVILSHHPRMVTRETLASGTGYPNGGASMKKGLAALRSRDLIVDYPAGGIHASDDLFPGRA